VVRALVIGSVTAVVSGLVGWQTIAWLRRMGIGKAISEEGPESHMVKAGTPTMGGSFVVATIVIVTLASNTAGHLPVLLPLGALVALGVFGIYDDSRTLVGREGAGGGHERAGFVVKEALFVAVGLIAGLILTYALDEHYLLLPGGESYEMQNVGFVLIAVLVVAATTSATAITDGLDGLLGGLLALSYGAYGVIAGLQGQAYLAVFCFTVVGALIGFLWHNAHPASVFMGESGAWPLGAGLAIVALMTGWWLLLPLVGIVLVAEGLSNIAQVGSFRLTGKRVLKMAPIHHHFELAGWAETQVVLRFWLVGALGSFVAIALVLTE
jgi:phospho-N-acetylmuramoyl-pentapeptide-transferase